MVLNFAHRGSLTEAPENTLSAFKKALEHEVEAIELDIQLTKDNHIVVIHDQSLARFNKNHPGFVKDYTLAEIKDIDVGSSFSQAFAGETLSTLEEILAICPEDLVINIEIKNIPIIYEGIEQQLIDVLVEHNRLHNVIISSFDHVSLQNVQKIAPNIPLGLLIYYRMIKSWEYATQTGLKLSSVHPHVSFTDKEFIDEFHRIGLKVYPFTVDHVHTYKKLLEFGVDGVFSNNPEIFKKKI